MRKILLFRGLPGAGKTTAVSDLGLEDYCLSPNEIGLLISSPSLSREGNMMMPVDQEVNHRAWSLLFSFLDERTQRGDFLVVDCNNASQADFNGLYKLAKRRCYDVACIDFSTMPLERVQEQNLRRPEHRRVPDNIIERMSLSLRSWTLPHDVRAFHWDEKGNYLTRVKNWMTPPLFDYSGYRAVVHIGDVQGCLEPLAGPRGLLKDGFSDDVRYIFTGDLLDRGPENGALLRWILDHALPRPNVDFIWGNHETHLVHWAFDEEVRSDEFTLRTLPQLEEADITQREVRILAQRLTECLRYRWHGYKVLVTHGGLSNVPANPALISGRQMTRGTGYWRDPVDEQFDANAPEGWYQVHGHRNYSFLPVAASQRSFNLEGGVEKGGHLRALRLDEAGFCPIEIRNRHVVPVSKRLPSAHNLLPPWLKRDDDGREFLSEQVLSRLMGPPWEPRPRSDDLQPFVALPDSRTGLSDLQPPTERYIRAKHLLVNAATREVVARGYSHRPVAADNPDALVASLVFPVTAYAKEDGFLGILGYDSENDGLIFLSGSQSASSERFGVIAQEQMSRPKLDAIRRFLRDTQSSMVFEVVDPIENSQIIAYEAPKLTLLDVFRRAPTTEKLSDKDLRKVAKSFGLECKELVATLKNQEQMLGFLRQAASPKSGQTDTEGFVMEDAEGRAFTVEAYHYAFWKTMRSAKECVRLALEKGMDPYDVRPVFNGTCRDRIWRQPAATQFLEWCMEQTPGTLRGNIISLREQFLEEMQLDHCPEGSAMVRAP